MSGLTATGMQAVTDGCGTTDTGLVHLMRVHDGCCPAMRAVDSTKATGKVTVAGLNMTTDGTMIIIATFGTTAKSSI